MLIFKGLKTELWCIRCTALLVIAASAFGMLDEYTLRLATVSAIFVLLAFGQDVACGCAGQLLLCQAAFFGFSAYASVLLVQRVDLPVWAAFMVAVLATVVFGAVIGRIASRTSGHYAAMVTISVSVIFQQVVLNWSFVTNGAAGLGNIRRLHLALSHHLFWSLDQNSTYLGFCTLVVAAAAEFLYLLHHSRLGALFLAIREDERAAESLGIRADKVKTAAFGLAALFAGLAGPLYAGNQRIISPEDFGLFQSILILLMVILGGKGT